MVGLGGLVIVAGGWWLVVAMMFVGGHRWCHRVTNKY